MEINWKRNTALFLAGQAMSLLGSMIVQYAIFWHITLKSQSGTMMMIYTVVCLLPMFFISPFAGVWADRFNRKYIINIADGSIAFVSLIVAILLVGGIDSYVILFVCAFVRAFGQGVQMPAVGAFIPQIVPKEHLTRINGIQTSIQSFITLGSPMIAAALMTFTPLYIMFLVDVATAIIGISILLFLVKIPAKGLAEIEAAKQKGTSYLQDLIEGLKYIRQHGYLFRIIIISAIFIFLFAPASILTPLQVVRNFGEDTWRLSAIEVAFSVGMMIGGVLVGMWSVFKNRIFVMALSCVLCGVFIVGLGITPIFWLYLAVIAALGFSMPFYNTHAMVLLQTTVEPSFMGRVMSVFTMVSTSTMPIGMLLFGPLSDKVSIDTILVVTGVMVSLLGIPMAASKVLREHG